MRVSTLLSLVLLSLVVQSSRAQPLDEISYVVSEVLSTSDWAADVNSCPSEMAQSKEASVRAQATDCRPGSLKSCLRRCQAGVPGACYWLGHAVRGEGKGRLAANVLYQRSCKLGVPSGCTNRAAGMSLESEGSETVQACAARTFEKTCGLDDPWGCTMYAFHLSRGLGTPANRELALEVLKKSCKYGPEDEACDYGLGLREQLLKGKGAAK